MKIVLASNSPRRKEILDNINVNYIVRPSGILENVRCDECPEQVAMSLALEKAIDVFDDSGDGELIIAADTIVAVDDLVLGKPVDRNDAKRMLTMLSGREHNVITGIAVVSSVGMRIVDFESTTVRFNRLSEELIERYLDTGEPMDKAGAYGIQGHGAMLVERIEGDYFNIVGLPVNRLNRILAEHFGVHLL